MVLPRGFADDHARLEAVERAGGLGLQLLPFGIGAFGGGKRPELHAVTCAAGGTGGRGIQEPTPLRPRLLRPELAPPPHCRPRHSARSFRHESEPRAPICRWDTGPGIAGRPRAYRVPPHCANPFLRPVAPGVRVPSRPASCPDVRRRTAHRTPPCRRPAPSASHSSPGYKPRARAAVLRPASRACDYSWVYCKRHGRRTQTQTLRPAGHVAHRHLREHLHRRRRRDTGAAHGLGPCPGQWPHRRHPLHEQVGALGRRHQRPPGRDRRQGGRQDRHRGQARDQLQRGDSRARSSPRCWPSPMARASKARSRSPAARPS